MNYKHLHYFWVVAREGSITRASERLHLTAQTISGQISQLEDYYGVKLFNKAGRGLALSEVGQQVFQYAEDIFSLGNELDQLLNSQLHQEKILFKVGIVDQVPKYVAHQLLLPLLHSDNRVKMNCREGDIESLIAELTLHRLDLVIAERPIPESISMSGVSKKLLESSVSFFAAKSLGDNLAARFPDCLHELPMLLPNNKSQAFSSMDRWFAKYKIKPEVVAEFDDSALMKAFGQEGVGVFPAPTVIKQKIEEQYQVLEIGNTAEVTQSFYAIYVEHRVNTPLVLKVINH